MSPARRSHKRRDWPKGLREPRPGYYVWDEPGPDGKLWKIGRVSLERAKLEAAAANLESEQHAASLVDRMRGSGETVAALMAHMPTPANPNTAKSTRSLDKRIKAGIGDVAAGSLTVRHCADLLDVAVKEGKLRLAVAVRSRLVAICKKGMAKGWMHANPAEATETAAPVVKRSRLTLEAFHAIHAVAAQAAEWLPHAMMLALVTGQDRSTVATMERKHVAAGCLTTWRSKTQETNQPVEIPVELRLDVVGVSLADLVAHRTGVVSRYLVHHVRPWGNAPVGSNVHPDRISHAFTEARQLAGIPDILPNGKGAPTFHEIRSLAKRLYDAQGGVDTKALLGHATERMGALYSDPRGVEPLRVRVG